MSPNPHPTDQQAVNAVLLDRSERVEHALFGNGQPGILERTAALETGQDDLRADLDERVPSVARKRAGVGGAIAGAVAFLVVLGGELARRWPV
jgi:hypothetical protein